MYLSLETDTYFFIQLKANARMSEYFQTRKSFRTYGFYMKFLS